MQCTSSTWSIPACLQSQASIQYHVHRLRPSSLIPHQRNLPHIRGIYCRHLLQDMSGMGRLYNFPWHPAHSPGSDSESSQDLGLQVIISWIASWSCMPLARMNAPMQALQSCNYCWHALTCIALDGSINCMSICLIPALLLRTTMQLWHRQSATHLLHHQRLGHPCSPPPLVQCLTSLNRARCLRHPKVLSRCSSCQFCMVHHHMKIVSQNALG